MASNPSTPPPPPSQLSQVPSQPVEGAPALSEGQRLAYTFFAPSKTFTDLRRSAAWWGPYLIIAIVSTMFVYVVDQKVGYRKVAENLIQEQPKQAARIDNLPADQREKVMQQQAGITKGISYAFPVVALLLYVVISGVYFGTLKFVGGGDLKFKTLFALVVYARLPLILWTLLGILSLLAGVSGDGFNMRNPVATNPGYFIGPDGSAVLRALLTPFDVFSFWVLILTAIGITRVSKVKPGAAFGVVFGWFAVYVLGSVLLAVAFS